MIPSDLVVVKLGGTTAARDRHALEDVARVAGFRPIVVVHGGGQRLTEWLDRLGVESRFENGLRVTDDAALEVAVAVLAGIVNTELVAALRAIGSRAVGVTGVELLAGERLDGLGRVARITALDEPALAALLASRVVPVVAPLVCDERGTICNVNADDTAAGIAAFAVAEQLVLMTDVDGVLDGDGRRLPELDADEAEDLIERGVVSAGMVPKVRACLTATANGRTAAVIVDGGAERPLERALRDASFGTRVRPSSVTPASAKAVVPVCG